MKCKTVAVYSNNVRKLSRITVQYEREITSEKGAIIKVYHIFSIRYVAYLEDAAISLHTVD